jgi:hypothetical protein
MLLIASSTFWPSTILLKRTNVQQQDPLGEAGWGTALWTEGQMKARIRCAHAEPTSRRARQSRLLDRKATRRRRGLDGRGAS